MRWLFTRRRLQFRLRSLLLLTFFAALACQWFLPFEREERGTDGSLLSRYTMRRLWNGSLVAAGEQWEFYEGTSRPKRRWTQSSGSPGGECDGETCSHWGEDGSQVSGDFDHLIWLITNTISPDSWTDNGGSGSISGFATCGCCVVSNDDDEGDVEEDYVEEALTDELVDISNPFD